MPLSRNWPMPLPWATRQGCSIAPIREWLSPRCFKLLKTGKIDKREKVVVISTAHGLKFTDFKVQYHEKKLEFPCTYANKPIELPPTVDAVKKALEQALKNRRTMNV